MTAGSFSGLDLVRRCYRSLGTPFRPVFLDGFYEGGTLVQFTRSGGKVTGFEVTPGGLGG